LQQNEKTDMSDDDAVLDPYAAQQVDVVASAWLTEIFALCKLRFPDEDLDNFDDIRDVRRKALRRRMRQCAAHADPEVPKGVARVLHAALCADYGPDSDREPDPNDD
jgi:hypothetical protein